MMKLRRILRGTARFVRLTQRTRPWIIIARFALRVRIA
jgi:hypothetical protein